MLNLAVTRKRQWWFNAILIATVLILYAPSIHFGLIWDDPKWYQQGAGQSVWQLFTPLDTYQFYRPLAVWLNRQLVAPAGLVAAPAAHFFQIVTHLMAALAVVPVLRTFKFDVWPARFAALVFVLYPLSYQAVAWQAPQQPIALLAVFVAILAADRYVRTQQNRFLVMSSAAYAFALLFQESALPFVFAFFWLALAGRQSQTSPSGKRIARVAFGWPMVHLALAAAYFVIWLNVPRQTGIT